MDIHFETGAEHAERVADSILIVNDEFLRQDMYDLAVRRQRHGSRRLDDAANILAIDLARPRGNGRHAAAVETPDVRSGKADINSFDLAARHGFGLMNTFLDRLHGRLEVDDRSPLQPFGLGNTKADRLEAVFQFVALRAPAHRRNQRAYFGRTDIEAYNVFFSASHTMFPPASSSFILTMTWFLKRRSTRAACGYCW